MNPRTSNSHTKNALPATHDSSAILSLKPTHTLPNAAMDDDFDDPELWAAADRAASAASAPAQRQPQQHARTIQQPTPQLLDKRPPPRAPSSSEGGKVVQPTPQRLDKAAPPRATASGEGRVVQPTPQALPQRSSGSNILVSPRQKGNPVLQCIKSVPWEYSDIPADYGLGLTTCALFLRCVDTPAATTSRILTTLAF